MGLSPLSTVHPNILQHVLVRSSTRSYPRFNLTMDRSLGVVSTLMTGSRFNTRFRFGFGMVSLNLAI